MITVAALDSLPTPVVAIELEAMEANIRAMQEVCTRHGVQLWPHIKTHKMVEIARRQLAAGAAGLTCAKLGEAEAMLPSGVRRIFIAHSLVDLRQAPRLRRLRESLDELVLAVTSPLHAAALERLLAHAGLTLPVLMAVDTGLGREGARTAAGAQETARAIAASPHLRLIGLYTHEGQTYGLPPAERPAFTRDVLARLAAVRDTIDPRLTLWPGCSVTASTMAQLPGVHAVRPGAYVLADLALAETTQVVGREGCALTVVATVVDKPEPDLALIDAGSKVFSSDKTPAGHAGRAADGRDLNVVRCNEEHGYVRGSDVAGVAIGDRIAFIPAHVCTVVNLTDTVAVVAQGRLAATWRVDARGKVT
ncbi:MAG: alanine racemase [Opitutaceae bacterium]|nr:alanine racemase [Opitutaceae bacterium]